MHKTMMTSGRWVVPLVVAVWGLSATTFGKMQAPGVSERQLGEALSSGRPLTDLSLAVDWGFRQLNTAEYAVLVGVRIAAPGQPAAARSRLDLIAAASDPAGTVMHNLRDRVEVTLGETSARTPIVYGWSLVLLPGRYTLRVVARDPATGRIGSSDVSITIPNLARQQVQ